MLSLVVATSSMSGVSVWVVPGIGLVSVACMVKLTGCVGSLGLRYKCQQMVWFLLDSAFNLFKLLGCDLLFCIIDNSLFSRIGCFLSFWKFIVSFLILPNTQTVLEC